MIEDVNGFKPGSKAWKQFMQKLYGIGASIVIIGALFKIQHWEYASEMLIVGLGTEALIFFISAFEPPFEEPKWELVYPELATEEGRALPPTQQLDELLEESGIDQALIQRLGDGMKNLGDQAQSLSDVTDAAAATNEYSGALRTATDKITELGDTYETASESLTGLTANQEIGQTTGDSLQKMNENLGSLNGMYETQLAQMEQNSQLFDGMGKLLDSLNGSVDDTEKYKESIAELAKNLESLNVVYGNMLNAMGGSKS
jgi:gliding motility-associated protein GldL